jgi:hypothetical protein
MSEGVIETGRAALAAALARAGRRASTAAVVAALVPLATLAVPSPAHAVTGLCTTDCESGGTSAGSGSVTDYTYDFTGWTGNTTYNRIEIPELQAGEFLTTGSSGALQVSGLPSGWSISQRVGSSAFSSDGATFKSPSAGTPAAFIEIIGGEGTYLGTGSTMSMDVVLYSDYAANIGANVVLGASSGGEGQLTIDPPSPNPAPAPEPGSLALVGTALAGLAGMRRKKA